MHNNHKEFMNRLPAVLVCRRHYFLLVVQKKVTKEKYTTRNNSGILLSHYPAHFKKPCKIPSSHSAWTMPAHSLILALLSYVNISGKLLAPA
jgi:hypothetical protein